METNPAFQKLIEKKKKSGSKLSPNQMKAHESVMADLSSVLSETGVSKLTSSKNPKQANPKAETAEDAVEKSGGKHVAEGESLDSGESNEDGVVAVEIEVESEEPSGEEESEEGMYSDSSDAPKSREQLMVEIENLKKQLADRG